VADPISFPLSHDTEAQRKGGALVGGAVLQAASVALAIANDPIAAVQGGIRLLRAAQANDFLNQWRDEYARLSGAGRIKADYLETPQAKVLFADTLQALESETLDADQVRLLRKLFMAAATETATDRESLLPREYLALGTELSAGEIRILAITFAYVSEWRAMDDTQKLDQIKSKRWRGIMKERTGLEHVALIQKYDRALIEKGLLAEDPPAETTHIKHDRYRLTDLGIAFCKYLASADDPVMSP
jgi:hypothetical protein